MRLQLAIAWRAGDCAPREDALEELATEMRDWGQVEDSVSLLSELLIELIDFPWIPPSPSFLTLSLCSDFLLLCLARLRETRPKKVRFLEERRKYNFIWKGD